MAQSVIQRNPQPTQPETSHKTSPQPCQPNEDKKLALTIKHTVEFSNNRRTPSRTGHFHVPAPIRGNFSSLPDSLGRSNPSDSQNLSEKNCRCKSGSLSEARGTMLPDVSEWISSPGAATRSLGCPSACRADIENSTRARSPGQSRGAVAPATSALAEAIFPKKPPLPHPAGPRGRQSHIGTIPAERRTRQETGKPTSDR
jgi:hypothetical protein